MNFRFSDLKSQRKPNGVDIPVLPQVESPSFPAAPAANSQHDSGQDYLELKVRLHQRLIEEINLNALERVDRADLAHRRDGAPHRQAGADGCRGEWIHSLPRGDDG